MNICVIIVTYGNRFHLLDRVIQSLPVDRVLNIIVVDNNSHYESREQLRIKEKELNGILEVLYLPENLGSAGGYKSGLEKARKHKECEFIWLLDDDNVPTPHALDALIDFWKSFNMSNKNERLCLLSYRESSPMFKELARRDSLSIEPILGTRNAFLGLNFLHPFTTRRNAELFRPEIKEHRINLEKRYGKIPIATYGGMFFSKLILDTIGYPDERLFLYCDDYEFSHRIIQHYGEIILLLDSQINDIDITENKGMAVNEQNLFRLYYTNRNYVYFQKNLSDNRLIFTANYLIYYFYLKLRGKISILFNNANTPKYSVWINAICDGFNERLNKREDRVKSD